MTDPLKAMGIDLEEALKVDKSLSTKRPRDGRICICGHGTARHTEVAGMTFCKPSKMDCPCKKERLVLDADSTRPFLRKTEGGGPMHALIRGLSVLINQGKTAEWIVELKCDRCGADDVVVAPVPVTQNGVASVEATGYDALLCQGCREVI
jgi:hypothetical protein